MAEKVKNKEIKRKKHRMTCNFIIICARPLGVRMHAERHVSVTSFNESINVRKGVIASLSCHRTP